MLFPIGATKKERETIWECLAEITESDLGLDTPENRTARPKFAVRVILTNKDGRICLVVSKRNDYCQLPGGGVEKDESIEDALLRETREETGYTIRGIRPIGYTSEKRHTGERISYAYVAETDEFVGTKYEKDEIAEGFEPEWVSKDYALEKLEREGVELANKTDKSYNGTFANRRDLILLKVFDALT